MHAGIHVSLRVGYIGFRIGRRLEMKEPTLFASSIAVSSHETDTTELAGVRQCGLSGPPIDPVLPASSLMLFLRLAVSLFILSSEPFFVSTYRLTLMEIHISASSHLSIALRLRYLQSIYLFQALKWTYIFPLCGACVFLHVRMQENIKWLFQKPGINYRLFLLDDGLRELLTRSISNDFNGPFLVWCEL